MVMKSVKKTYDKKFFECVTPVKLTECRNLNLHTESWGLISNYYLESVKINCYKPNEVTSAAILKIADISGQTTCVVKGKTIGLLFGLSSEEWVEMESLCSYGQQLFFRNFKDGLSKNFRCEQKLFYNFCMSNQKEEPLVAIFYRAKNTRNKDKDDYLINILQLRKPNSLLLDLYLSALNKLN